MENNQDQQTINSQDFQDQNIPLQSQDVKIHNSQQIVYPKNESFFRKVVKDKQKLLLFICSLGLFVGIINSIALIHVLSRQDRPAQYKYHNGMMGPGGLNGNYYYDNGKERGNNKGNLPDFKGKEFQFNGGTFELPGGGTLEIKPGSRN